MERLVGPASHLLTAFVETESAGCVGNRGGAEWGRDLAPPFPTGSAAAALVAASARPRPLTCRTAGPPRPALRASPLRARSGLRTETDGCSGKAPSLAIGWRPWAF